MGTRESLRFKGLAKEGDGDMDQICYRKGTMSRNFYPSFFSNYAIPSGLLIAKHFRI